MKKNISVDYDLIVLEFQKDGKSAGSISVKKSDVDTLINNHGQTLSTVIGDMAQTLEDGIRENQNQN